LTGTETSPNEIVAVAIERAGMVGNQGGGREVDERDALQETLTSCAVRRKR
jgi:hypothetical protein